MAASFNKAFIVGNITKDPVLRYTPGGTATVTYTIAADDVFNNGRGEKVKRTDYIPITTYGKQAENDAKYLKKGSSVHVEFKIRSWYNADERKGGFNFEAVSVQYLGRPGGVRDSAEGGQVPGVDDAGVHTPDNMNADHAAWLDDYSNSNKG